MVQGCDTVKTLPRRKRLQSNWLQRTWSRFGYYLFSPSRRRPGPMLPQAPEFDHFCDRVPSDSPTPAALWVPACPTDLGPWAESPRDGVICSEGAMKARLWAPLPRGETGEGGISMATFRALVLHEEGGKVVPRIEAIDEE